MSARLALVAAVVLFAGALAATFLPTEPLPSLKCGTWVAPEWDEDEAQKMIEGLRETYEKADALGAEDIAGDSYGLARNIRRATEECGAALSTRRTVALSLLGLAVLVPGAIVFVARGRRPEAV